MVMMVCVATMPIPVVCPTAVSVPPTRPVAPIPRAVPGVPGVAPEPIVDKRSIDKYRFYNVVSTVYILITYNLNGYVVRFVFLHIDGGYVLEYILCENSLQYNQTLVAFTRLYDA